MSHATRVIAAFAMLLPIAVLARAQAVSPKAVATHAVLQAVDADSLDDYVRASHARGTVVITVSSAGAASVVQ